MRHRLAVVMTCGGALAARSTPDHGNVLIFATNTKVALDVSVSPTNAAPDVTLGCKRQEGVWMPLSPNSGSRDQRTAMDCGIYIHNCGFVGTEGSHRDTYSVLASFGATFEGSTQSSGSNAQDKVARPLRDHRPEDGSALLSFFAAGLAARKPAETGGARLVSIS